MITVQWDDAEKTLLLFTITTGWKWEDYWSAFAESLRMNEGLSHRVDVVVDSTGTNDLPVGALGAFRTLHNRLPDNVGLIVIAGGSKVSHSIIQIMCKLYRIHSWRTVYTVEEARQEIAADRVKVKNTL